MEARIGIKGETDGPYVECWRKGAGDLTAGDVANGGLFNVSARVPVEPKDSQTAAQYSYNGTYWRSVTSSDVIPWDMQTNLKFRCFDSAYFDGIRDYDAVDFTYPNYTAKISQSPGGEAVSDGLDNMESAQEVFDLYDYAGNAAALTNGSTYYLQLAADEHYGFLRLGRRF